MSVSKKDEFKGNSSGNYKESDTRPDFPRGMNRGKGDFHKEFNDDNRGLRNYRGGIRGANRKFGYSRGRFNGMNRGRGPNRAVGKMHGADRQGNGLQGRKRNRERIPHEEDDWPSLIREEPLADFMRHRIQEYGNYKVIKHLFEELENDSFRKELRIFNKKTLPEVLLLLSNVTCNLSPKLNKVSDKNRESHVLWKEVTKGFPSLTLKESLKVAKIHIINGIRKKNFLRRIEAPGFPKVVPCKSLLLKNEVASLMGVAPIHQGRDLIKCVSTVGRLIVAIKHTEMLNDTLIKAAEYFIQHPERSPDAKFE